MIISKTLLKTALVVLIVAGGRLGTGDSKSIVWPWPTRDVRCLVDNVYHEARGEPVRGQQLVAKVTINRANLAEETICQTVYKPKQFSWTNQKPKLPDRSSEAYKTAYYAAYQAINLKYEATYYHTARVHPRWDRKLVRVAKVGNHIFYKTV